MTDKFTRRVRAASRVSRWTAPPARLRGKVIGLARGRDIAPGPAARPRVIPRAAADVRGGGPGGAPETRMVSYSFPGAEVGLLTVPPAGDDGWRIEGRVWLAVPSERPIRVLLIHEDHVLAETSLLDGSRFRIDETVGPGWCLELHLPDGETIVLEDPSK